LDKAITCTGSATFAAAYEGLTAGCTQCHAATGYPFVVMQTPNVAAFPDQGFQPVAP